MALEYICADKISNARKIPIPPGTRLFKVKSGKIRFFRCNGEARYILMNDTKMKAMPNLEDSAAYVEFPNYRRHDGNRTLNYGTPVFYDNGGNILKIQKR